MRCEWHASVPNLVAAFNDSPEAFREELGSVKGLGGASAGYSVLDFELTHLDFLNLETWRSDGCCVTSYPRFGVFTLLDFAGALTQKEILILLGASKHAQCKKAGKAKKWFTYVSVSEVHEFC